MQKLLLISALTLLLMFGKACVQSNSSLGENFPREIDFNFHIRPILSDRCFPCHGPDDKTREGNLRLDVEEGAFAALDSLGTRFAIVPSKENKSALMHRITSADP